MSSARQNMKSSFLVSLCLTSSCLIANDAVRPAQSPIGFSITEEAQFPNAQTDIMGFRLCLLYGRHNCATTGWGYATAAYNSCAGYMATAWEKMPSADKLVDGFIGILKLEPFK